MAEIKLTKNELRSQQQRLAQLEKYLPTLQLKKAMLQLEVNDARSEISKSEAEYEKVHNEVEEYSLLVSDTVSFDFTEAAKVTKIAKRYENIAGVEVPYFDGITFENFSYTLFDTPAWVDSIVVGLRSLAEARAKISVAREKKAALEKELRSVSIRVNLFEKILIPRALDNIKKIKVFLGDQQLSAVSQAKVAKEKIEAQKREVRLAKSLPKENRNAR
jgi:V/A-type H+/Na+-transporting ATPase subunit D